MAEEAGRSPSSRSESSRDATNTRMGPGLDLPDAGSPLYWMTPAPLIPEEIPGHVGWGIGLLVRSRVAVTTGVRWDLEGVWDGENRLLSADRATPSRVQVPVWAGPV